ncbi:MAG TPA: hypothetical protein VEN81_11315 [Planctomycetota bacterium]|jgi:nitrate reductase NapE component|nr:hypothetical protein [Planctomycetota bacterium]
MSPSLPEPGEIRRRLEEAVQAERKDALTFSVLTVILTPAFVAVAVFILLVALHQLTWGPAGRGGGIWSGGALVNGTALFLGAACVAYCFRGSGQPGFGKEEVAWLGAAIGGLAGLLLLAYGTPLREAHPGAFWPLFWGITLVLLGILGRGYVPRDHDYVRPGEWNYGESMFETEARETNFWLGWVVAFPRLLLGSYGDLFGSLWLWEGMGEGAAQIAVDVLGAVGRGDPKAALDRVRRAPPAESGRALRWLARLKYVRFLDRGWVLSSEGESFLGVGRWTV